MTWFSIKQLYSVLKVFMTESKLKVPPVLWNTATGLLVTLSVNAYFFSYTLKDQTRLEFLLHWLSKLLLMNKF